MATPSRFVSTRSSPAVLPHRPRFSPWETGSRRGQSSRWRPFTWNRRRCPHARPNRPTGLPQAPAYTRAIMALRRVASLIALVLGTLLAVGHAQAADPTGVGRIRLTGVIDQVNAAYIEEALKSAADSDLAAETTRDARTLLGRTCRG